MNIERRKSDSIKNESGKSKIHKSSSSKNIISKKQYSYTEEGFVVLEYDLIRRFLELLERGFQKERRYDYKFGLKTRDGLKLVQKITIVEITVKDLTEFCTEKTSEFI